MNRNPELLKAVAAAPDDEAPRRVYADWWMQAGEPRGEFINACLTLHEKIDPARRAATKKQVAELLAKHQPAWTQDVKALGATAWTFVNGFIEAIEIGAPALQDGFARLMALEPIERLTVDGLANAGTLAEFARIRTLKLIGNVDTGAESLAEAEHCGGLQRLMATGISGDALLLLAESETLTGLTSLSLTGTEEIGDVTASMLGEPAFALERLFLARVGMTDEGAAAIGKSKGLAGLKMLALGGNEDLSNEGLGALAKSKTLSNLEHLELDFTGCDDEGLVELRDRKKLPKLKRLAVRGLILQDETVDVLRQRLGDGLVR